MSVIESPKSDSGIDHTHSIFGDDDDGDNDDGNQHVEESEDIDDKHEGSDNEGYVGSEEFPLAEVSNPLGGEGGEYGEEQDNGQLGCGMVADVDDFTADRIQAVAAAAGRVLPVKTPYRRKTFCITFDSRKQLSFEFLTNMAGAVVVSHVFKSIDERLHRGVVIVGVNDSVLEVSDDASKELESLLDSASAPFRVVFAEYEEEEHAPAEYEEDSIDNEENSGKCYASTSSNSSDKDCRVGDHGRHRLPLQQDVAAAASTSASLFTSSIYSLTNRMRNFVLPPQHQEPSQPAAAPVHSGENRSSPRNTPSLPDNEDDACNGLPENCFELILSTRSPPFVFDLHADGSSIVVVKLVGDRKSMDPRLQEGAVVRLVNSMRVNCKTRQEFDAMLTAVPELPLRMVLEHAPALYRHQDALSLFTSSMAEQAIHVYTVTPHLHPGSTSSRGGKHTAPRFDDVYHTTHRALEVLQAFRAQGVAASLVSVETVLLAPNCSAYAGTLHQPGGASRGLAVLTSSSSGGELIRAVRVWFRFSDAQDVVVDNPAQHLGALEVSRSGQQGSWIVIRCLDSQSAWVDAGMVIGRPYLVTHVNGLDVSAGGYRSVNCRIGGDGTWDGSVLPQIFGADQVKFTIV